MITSFTPQAHLNKLIIFLGNEMDPEFYECDF